MQKIHFTFVRKCKWQTADTHLIIIYPEVSSFGPQVPHYYRTTLKTYQQLRNTHTEKREREKQESINPNRTAINSGNRGKSVCVTNVKSLLAALGQNKTDTPVTWHIYYLTGHDGTSGDQERPMLHPENLLSGTDFGGGEILNLGTGFLFSSCMWIWTELVTHYRKFYWNLKFKFKWIRNWTISTSYICLC